MFEREENLLVNLLRPSCYLVSSLWRKGGGLLAIDVNRWIPAIVFVFVVVEHMCKLKKSLEDASVFHAWS